MRTRPFTKVLRLTTGSITLMFLLAAIVLAIGGESQRAAGALVGAAFMGLFCALSFVRGVA